MSSLLAAAHRRNAGGGGGGFVPTDLSGCLLWLPVDGVPLGLASSWANSGTLGSAADAAAAGSDRPTSTVNILNGHRGVVFDGAANAMTIANGFTNLFKGSDSWVIFMVISVSNTSAAPVLLDAPGLGDVDFFSELTPSGSFYWGAGGGSFRTYSSPTLSAGAFVILTLRKTGSTTGTLYVNGVPSSSFVGSFATSSNSDSDLLIGKYRNGTVPLNGSICEAAAFNPGLSDAAINQMGGYIAAWSGIAWTNL